MKAAFTKKQEGYHRVLIKRFHTLINRLEDPVAAKEEILMSYNVASSKYLTIDQLNQACHRIELDANPYIARKDKARKRLIAAIGGWLRAMNKTETLPLIKGIACRASGKDDFNQIPLEQLRSLYNAFLKKQKDLNSVEDLTAIELDYLSQSN